MSSSRPTQRECEPRGTIIEDILVNGGPWNTRIALRVHGFVPATDGGEDVYNNRAVLFLEIRWGRLIRWEDYEHTERLTAWDARDTARQLNA